MTLGSLFDGSGGFPLGGVLAGIKPVWKSEIEPYTVLVTHRRFSEVKYYGDVNRLSGFDLEPVDIITFGSPCFPAGTLVLTSYGYIPIEDVHVGDLVLTHTGNWQKVTDVGFKNAETVVLRGNHYGLECTPNHPIYSAEVGILYYDEEGKKCNRLNLLKERKWIDAENMKDRFWGVPRSVSKLPEDIPISNNPRENQMPEMNEDFWYLVGRWVGDGWVRDSQRLGRPCGQQFDTIIICDGLDKEDELVDAVAAVVKNYSIERGATGVKVKFNGRLFCDWLTRNFGKYATGKFIAPWVYGIKPEYRNAFLHGILDTDGNCMKTTTESWNISSYSEALAQGIRILAELEGYSTTIHKTIQKPATEIEGRIVNVHPENYQVRITASDRKRIHLFDKLHSWYRVRSVEKTGEIKKVFNLTVENDNSYVANGIVVHNCQDLSIAGLRRGLELEGGRSNLFYQAVRIIKEMREATNGQYPRYCVWENVCGALSSNNGEDFRKVLEEISRVKTEVSIPRPDGKWTNAGEIMGDGFSIAWRVLDAQYWGTPQRRKRIFLVADFDGSGAGEVLFVSEGLSGYSAEGFRSWQRAANSFEKCIGAAGSQSGNGRTVRNG